MVREKTGGGEALVEFYWNVFQGKPLEDGRMPTAEQRMKAAEWLTDRGFGKAVTPIDLTTTDGKGPQLPFNPAALSPAALEELVASTAPVIDVGGDEPS